MEHVGNDLVLHNSPILTLKMSFGNARLASASYSGGEGKKKNQQSSLPWKSLILYNCKNGLAGKAQEPTRSSPALDSAV